jgi:hypothetical protein
MANQPEHTPKGQIAFNSGAKPASTRVGVSSRVTSKNMKRIKHDQKLQAHNDNLKGATQG